MFGSPEALSTYAMGAAVFTCLCIKTSNDHDQIILENVFVDFEANLNGKFEERATGLKVSHYATIRFVNEVVSWCT